MPRIRRAVSVCVCMASAVTMRPARSISANRSRTAGISLVLSATCTCPRTRPEPCSSAATKWQFSSPSICLEAPRTRLPSSARAPSGSQWDAAQSRSARSSASPSTDDSTRKNVVCPGAVRRRPPAGVQPRTAPSWRWFRRFANSAVGATPDAPHNCAARAIASTVANWWRRPRRARKSGTPRRWSYRLRSRTGSSASGGGAGDAQPHAGSSARPRSSARASRDSSRTRIVFGRPCSR